MGRKEGRRIKEIVGRQRKMQASILRNTLSIEAWDVREATRAMKDMDIDD